MFKPGDIVIALETYDNLIVINNSYIIERTGYVKNRKKYYVILQYPPGFYIEEEKFKLDIKYQRIEKLKKICKI